MLRLVMRLMPRLMLFLLVLLRNRKTDTGVSMHGQGDVPS